MTQKKQMTMVKMYYAFCFVCPWQPPWTNKYDDAVHDADEHFNHTTHITKVRIIDGVRLKELFACQ